MSDKFFDILKRINGVNILINIFWMSCNLRKQIAWFNYWSCYLIIYF